MGCEICGSATCIRSFHSMADQEDHDKTKDDVMNERAALRARIEVLEKVVSEYTRHDEDCSAFSFDNKCSCGLRAALAALKEGRIELLENLINEAAIVRHLWREDIIGSAHNGKIIAKAVCDYFRDALKEG